jgi:hypothetical protein
MLFSCLRSQVLKCNDGGRGHDLLFLAYDGCYAALAIIVPTPGKAVSKAINRCTMLLTSRNEGDALILEIAI